MAVYITWPWQRSRGNQKRHIPAWGSVASRFGKSWPSLHSGSQCVSFPRAQGLCLCRFSYSWSAQHQSSMEAQDATPASPTQRALPLERCEFRSEAPQTASSATRANSAGKGLLDHSMSWMRHQDRPSRQGAPGSLLPWDNSVSWHGLPGLQREMPGQSQNLQMPRRWGPGTGALAACQAYVAALCIYHCH